MKKSILCFLAIAFDLHIIKSGETSENYLNYRLTERTFRKKKTADSHSNLPLNVWIIRLQFVSKSILSFSINEIDLRDSYVLFNCYIRI